MKYDQLRKRTVVEAGIFAAAIAGLGVLVLGLGMVRDGFITDNDKLRNGIAATDADMGALKAKYSNILQNKALYDEVKSKNAGNMLAISRQAIPEKFAKFKELFEISNLRLSMSALQDVKDGQYRRKTSVINHSEVSVSLETLTDEHVYFLIESMQKELPGIIRIVKLGMTKDRPLTDEVLQSISQKGTFPLIKTELKFFWFGITPVENKENAADAPANIPQ